MSFKIPESYSGLNINPNLVYKAKRNEEIISKTQSKEIHKLYKQQIDLEKEFLANNKWKCPSNLEDSIIEISSKVDLEELNINDDSLFLDSKSLDHLICVSQNILLFDGPMHRTGYNYVKNIISDIRLIGSPSTFGYAMTATLYGKYKDMIVIKAPKTNEHYTDASTNHELTVGKIMNSLRYIIPNFVFTIGSFDCGPPIVAPSSKLEEQGKIINWCRSGRQVKYIIYENIKDSISLSRFCKSCNEQDYIDIIIQLSYALMIAYKKVGFTHYDLHGNNILVREVKDYSEGFYIPYGGDFIFSKYIATIIDYGYSHVYLPNSENVSLGFKTNDGPSYAVKLLEDGFYIDKPSPLADCYRLLTSTLKSMRSRNHKTYEKVKGLVYFFYDKDENIDKILNDKELDYLPLMGETDYTNKVSKFRYESFIKYCREFCDINDLNDPVVSGKSYSEEMDEFVIFTPKSRTIITPSNKELDLKINNIEELIDILEPISLYNKYLIENSKTISQEKIPVYNRLLNKIYTNVKSQKNNIKMLLEEEIYKVKDAINNTPLITYKMIHQDNVHILRNPTAMKDYLKAFENTVYHLDNLDSLERKIEMLKYINDVLFNTYDEDLKDLLTEFKRKDDRSVILSFIKRDALAITNYLDSKRKYDDIDDKLEEIVNSLYASIPNK